MKKTMALLLTVFLIFSFTSQTFAVGIVYQNKPITTDVPPRIIDGRTLVPIRAINDALNGETSWNKQTQQVTLKKGNMNIILKIGDRVARIDGKEVKMDVPAQILSGRTFVPLRFVSQHFGHNVEWDSSTQMVLIDSNKTTNKATNDFVSLNINDIDFTKIYEVQGTGKYAGFKKLVGYPYDDKYSIYYSGSLGSYHVTYEDLNPKNLQEKITWKYKGKTYTNTRSQLYDFFSDIIQLESLLGASEGIINQDWLAQTFGSTYREWFLQGMYSQEAFRIVSKYLEIQAGVDYSRGRGNSSIDVNDLVNSEVTKSGELVNLSNWISNNDLSKEKGISLSQHVKRIGNKTELTMVFIRSDSLSGIVKEVVYEVSDMPLDYLGNKKDSEDTFNGVKFMKVNGNIYINREDLKDRNIL